MATTKSPLAPMASVVGGALLAIGSLLTFATVEGFGSVSGLDTPDGKLFLGFGIGLLVLGGISFALSGVARRIIGVLIILAAGFMTYAAVVDLTGLKDDVGPEFRELVSAGIGLYIVLGGAVIGTIGGLLGVFGSAGGGTAAPFVPPPPPPAPPPPPQPPQV